MKAAFALLPLAALLSACGDNGPNVAVEDAIVRLPAVGGRPGVAYFTLRANRTPMRILGVTSPQVGRIELHQSVTIGGRVRMGPLEDNAFPAEGLRVFEEGGAHAMLFDIDPALRPGGDVQLTFDFDNAPDQSVTVQAQPAGGHGH